MAIEQKLMTADELLAMRDDGYKYELRQGELIRMVPPGLDHGRFGGRLYRPLADHVEARELGEVTFEFGFRLSPDPDTVRAPDVAFFRGGRVEPIGSHPGYVEGAPDLAVEVVSPNDTAADVREKVADYLSAGTRLVWLVYPRVRTVTIYRANGTVEERTVGQSLDGEDVVPGFSIPVERIFR